MENTTKTLTVEETQYLQEVSVYLQKIKKEARNKREAALYMLADTPLLAVENNAHWALAYNEMLIQEITHLLMLIQQVDFERIQMWMERFQDALLNDHTWKTVRSDGAGLINQIRQEVTQDMYHQYKKLLDGFENVTSTMKIS